MPRSKKLADEDRVDHGDLNAMGDASVDLDCEQAGALGGMSSNEQLSTTHQDPSALKLNAMFTALCGQMEVMQREMSSTFAKNSVSMGELSERFRQHECDANKQTVDMQDGRFDGTRPKQKVVFSQRDVSRESVGRGSNLSGVNQSMSEGTNFMPMHRGDMMNMPVEHVRKETISEPVQGLGSFISGLTGPDYVYSPNACPPYQPNANQRGGQNRSVNPETTEFVGPYDRQRDNARDYPVPHYQMSRSRPRSHDDYWEDTHARIRQFNAKETDWFSYRSYFEAVANQAGWSDRTKSVKLMAALDGSLIGITTGMNGQITYPDLLAKLDGIHGIENAREDAALKISSCRKKDSETVAMYAERVRQLVERAYPSYTSNDKDEQALRAFLLGLPTRYDMRLKMRLIRFTSLHEAVIYGSNLEHILKDEKQSEKDQLMSRTVRDENVPETEKLSKMVDQVSKDFEKIVDEKLFSFRENGNKSFDRYKSQDKHEHGSRESDERPAFKKTPQNSPCHGCGEIGHWRNECPKFAPKPQEQNASRLN